MISSIQGPTRPAADQLQQQVHVETGTAATAAAAAAAAPVAAETLQQPPLLRLLPSEIFSPYAVSTLNLTSIQTQTLRDS